MRPDDAFWAARIVARFSDAAIRAVVEKARYSDPRATDYITQTLIARRDKVLRTWLNGVNPVVDPTLTNNGRLSWGNAAIAARVADDPKSYTLQWFAFDNATGEKRDVGEAQTASTTESTAPAALLERGGDYVGVVVTAQHPQQPSWAKPATFYFRRSGSGWILVGAERD
jgi:hypothetical protein